MRRGIYTYDACRYNIKIDCTETDIKVCKKCGWNPDVDRERRGKRKLEKLIESGLPCYVLRDTKTGHRQFLMENPLYIGTANSQQPILELHMTEEERKNYIP